MAVLFACSVRDEALQAFNRPIFVNALGLAIRSFEDECRRESPDNAMRNHPKDFSLWHIGSYDEGIGRLTALDVPVRLCDAASVGSV